MELGSNFPFRRVSVLHSGYATVGDLVPVATGGFFLFALVRQFPGSYMEAQGLIEFWWCLASLMDKRCCFRVRKFLLSLVIEPFFPVIECFAFFFPDDPFSL